MSFYVTFTLTLLCATIGAYFIYKGRMQVSPLRCAVRTLDIFVRNAPALLLLGAIAFLPAWLMGKAIPEEPEPSFFNESSSLIEAFATFLLYVGGLFLLPALLASATFEGQGRGRLKLSQAFLGGLHGLAPGIWLAPLLGLYALCAIGFVAFLLVVISGLAELTEGANGLLAGVGATLSIGFLSPCTLSPSVAVNEDKSPARALNRSGDLMRQQRGTVLVLLFGWATLLGVGRIVLSLPDPRFSVLDDETAYVAFAAAWFPVALVAGVLHAEAVKHDPEVTSPDIDLRAASEAFD